MMRRNLLDSSFVKSLYVAMCTLFFLLLSFLCFGNNTDNTEQDSLSHYPLISGISQIHIIGNTIIYTPAAEKESIRISENTKKPKKSTEKHFRSKEEEIKLPEKVKNTRSITSGSDSALEKALQKSCSQCVLSGANSVSKAIHKNSFAYYFPGHPPVKAVFNKDYNSIRLSRFFGKAFSIRPPPMPKAYTLS